MSAYRSAWTEDLPGLAPEWYDLAERAGASPFATPGWTEAWWTAFGSGRLRILTARSEADGSLSAVLPLRQRYGVLSSNTNWHSHELGVLAERPEAATALLESLMGERPRRVALGFLDAPQADQVQAAAVARGYRVIRRTISSAPYVAIDRDLEGYEALLSRKVRQELRRRHRRLGALGAVSVEIASREPLEGLLEEGFGIEGSGWKIERGTAIQCRPELRRFYTDVARWAAARGWLRLAFLRLDGRAIAFQLCLESRGVHYLLKAGYDPAYRELGPGRLLRHEMLARAFAKGITSYEFLGDASPWKLECTANVRARELVQGFRRSPLGALDWSAFAFGRPLAKNVRALACGRWIPSREPRGLPSAAD